VKGAEEMWRCSESSLREHVNKGVLKARSHSATATPLDIFSDACTTAGFSLSALPH